MKKTHKEYLGSIIGKYKYNWEGINFPAGSKEWQKFEKNNTIVLNILYVEQFTNKISIVYKSKYNDW